MLFLVGNVGEPIGYVFCVFPLVEFCLRPDFRVYTVENLLADFTEFYSPKPSPSPRSTSQSATETPTSLCIAANPFYLTTRPSGQRKTKTTCST